MTWLERIVTAPVWEVVFWGNPLERYAVALGVFIGVLIAVYLLERLVLVRLKGLSARTATGIDDVVIALVDSIRPPFYVVIALYIGIRSLELAVLVTQVVTILLLLVVVYQVIRTVGTVIDHVVQKRFADDVNAQNAARFLTIIAKMMLWVLGLLLVLQNAGVNVTSLIAGLGIGGIAIAFALQNILEDLFSSFAIFFDKPFEIGDFIVIGADAGVVQKIGIKTTRIRSLQGEEIVVSNKELTASRIQNFRKLQERRVVFSFGVTYETPNAKLEQIPTMVREAVASLGGVRFDRAHFKSFGDSSLDYEVVYFVESDEYNDYMNVQQAINLGLKARFEKAGIGMAYPTRTVYLSQS